MYKKRMMIRRFFRMIASGAAFLLLLPLLLWSRLPLPEYSTFTAPSQLLALIPGLIGVLLRRVWYQFTLKSCGTNLTVDWMAVIRTRKTEVGDRVTLGVNNWVSWAKIGNDVMTGSHVVLISGAHQHDFDILSHTIRDQQGQIKQIRVGSDVWVGSHTVIMNDVSDGTVIGAGSIVTKSFDSKNIIAGNPARILRSRGIVKES